METQLAEGATVSKEQVEKSLREQEQARVILQAHLAETLEQLGVRGLLANFDPCNAGHTMLWSTMMQHVHPFLGPTFCLTQCLQVCVQRNRSPRTSAHLHKRASLTMWCCVLLQEANEETVQQASTAAQLASQIDELHSHRVSWAVYYALCCTVGLLAACRPAALLLVPALPAPLVTTLGGWSLPLLPAPCDFCLCCLPCWSHCCA